MYGRQCNSIPSTESFQRKRFCSSKSSWFLDSNLLAYEYDQHSLIGRAAGILLPNLLFVRVRTFHRQIQQTGPYSAPYALECLLNATDSQMTVSNANQVAVFNQNRCATNCALAKPGAEERKCMGNPHCETTPMVSLSVASAPVLMYMDNPERISARRASSTIWRNFFIIFPDQRKKPLSWRFALAFLDGTDLSARPNTETATWQKLPYNLSGKNQGTDMLDRHQTCHKLKLG